MDFKSFVGRDALGLVARVIKSAPILSLNFDDSLIARGFQNYLEDALAIFDRYLSGNLDARLTPRHLFLAVTRGELSSIPWYAELNPLSFDSLPLISKRDLQIEPRKFMARDHSLDAGIWKKSTSGTSGPPIEIYYSPESYFESLFLSVRKIVRRRSLAQFDSRQQFIVHVTDTQVGESSLTIDPLPPFHVYGTIIVKLEDQGSLRELIRFLAATSPSVLTSRPEILDVLSDRWAAELGDSRIRPDIILTGGSNLTATRRAKIEHVLKAPVIDAYATSEFGLIASECDAHEGYHIDETRVVVEVVNSDGVALGPGQEGELVISSLTNRAMLLMRYRTGDLGLIMTTPCKCGKPGARITELSGRVVPLFRFGHHPAFSPTRFNDLFARFPLREYQISQVGEASIDVRIEPLASAPEPSILAKGITEYLQSNMPPDVSIVIRSSVFSQTEKFQRYRNVLDIAS